MKPIAGSVPSFASTSEQGVVPATLSVAGADRHLSEMPSISRAGTIRAFGFVLAASIVLSAAGALPAAEQLYGPLSPTDPELSRAGDFIVGVQTLAMEWTTPFPEAALGESPRRELRLEIWYPTETSPLPDPAVYVNETRSEKRFVIQGTAYRDVPVASGTFPLVVLSHGYTGYRTLMFYLGEHLASHGYIVAAPDHPGSTNEDIDSRNVDTRRAGFPDTLVHRARDQQRLLEWFAQPRNDIARRADVSSAGLIGYSMGGYGALNAVGGCYRFDSELMRALDLPDSLRAVFEFCNAGRDEPDPRWKAVVAMAPWGQLQRIHDPDSLAGIRVPTLFVVGEEDPLSGYRPGVGDLFDAMTKSTRFLLLYENAGHNIAPHPAPTAAYDTLDSVGHYREAAWDTQTINRINKHIVLAFLDCHVKKRAAACAMLPGYDAWPGFVDSWHRGLRFERARPDH